MSSSKPKIQVGGYRFFESMAWREAVRVFLGDPSNGDYRTVMITEGHVKICFSDGIRLRLVVDAGSYQAYGISVSDPCDGMMGLVIHCGDRREEVEASLAKFVKEDHVTMLVIKFQDGGQLLLRKTRGDGLSTSAENIPRDLIAFHPEWKDEWRKHGISVGDLDDIFGTKE